MLPIVHEQLGIEGSSQPFRLLAARVMADDGDFHPEIPMRFL